ncbi:Uncharacterized protein TCM_035608 [Theobroma cacao]|uniref:Putative plant transposon protein domain-containing protein n=1 Tax=Theobroma cacao TaxID=3641 RepID=A0A061FQE7_THECC|nr:Uncharacterized protein TCM_035608 [Theobroma cacao]
MLLVKHLSNVTKDRAVLLYAILSGKSINIGQLIFNNTIYIARLPKDGLWFPSLITALCKQASVLWTSNKELLHPQVPLDASIIHMFEAQQHSTISGSSSFAPRPSTC